jgi:4-amino-4-deoxy-L-arabinose transferase-like glycosyltransferase
MSGATPDAPPTPRGWRWTWVAVGVVLAGAAALRLIDLGAVRLDPFYDAAVRSMGMSWKNFFFGAWEPGGSAAIDKPPVDLWLQVGSVKLFGFGSNSLKLPEALGGIAAVGMMYAAVKRVWGFAAGIGAALALAVMPVEVITARSDTMDAVMMALLVGGLLLLIKACESGRTGWLLGAAAVLGVAFNVKLLETMVALPGLAVIALMGFRSGAPGWLRTRALPLAAAGVVYVAVALSWLGGTLLFPAHERPYAIGSTNGSAWNAAFVFNGTERINGKSLEAPLAGLQIANNPPQATLSEREAILITPPSPTRLLARVGPLSGERLGIEVLIALLLGVPAIAWGWRGPPLRRAVGIGLLVWFLTGLVLFSQMQRLHPRYVEGFTPAVAALVGIGVAWGAKARARKRLIFLVVALAALVVYSAHLLYGTPAVWWVLLGSAVGAVVLVVFDRRDTWVGAVALTLVAVLAIPTVASVRAVRIHASDAGIVGSMPADEVRALSAYLRASSGGTRYEVAIDSATRGSALIVKDGRAVVVLTTYQGRTLTTVAQLKQLIARGEVRYALLNSLCGKRTPRTDAACSEPALWVRAHGRDVSRQVGLTHRGVLWRLPETVG